MLPSTSPSPHPSPSHTAPPSVGVTPSEPLLSVGDPLTLTCTGGDCVGIITINFSWLLDGSPVDTSLVTVINSTTSQLSVTSATSADFGTYTCQVMSVHGTGSAVAYVRERGINHVCIVWLSNSTIAMFRQYHWVRGSAPHTECGGQCHCVS